MQRGRAPKLAPCQNRGQDSLGGSGVHDVLGQRRSGGFARSLACPWKPALWREALRRPRCDGTLTGVVWWQAAMDGNTSADDEAARVEELAATGPQFKINVILVTDVSRKRVSVERLQMQAQGESYVEPWLTLEYSLPCARGLTVERLQRNLFDKFPEMVPERQVAIDGKLAGKAGAHILEFFNHDEPLQRKVWSLGQFALLPTSGEVGAQLWGDKLVEDIVAGGGDGEGSSEGGGGGDDESATERDEGVGWMEEEVEMKDEDDGLAGAREALARSPWLSGNWDDICAETSKEKTEDLRKMLEDEGMDTRGPKEALVSRICGRMMATRNNIAEADKARCLKRPLATDGKTARC